MEYLSKCFLFHSLSVSHFTQNNFAQLSLQPKMKLSHGDLLKNIYLPFFFHIKKRPMEQDSESGKFGQF